MDESCYTCDYVIRERNEITGEYLYFCKKLRKSVLWNCRCGFYKHDKLSPEEQELQDLMDKLCVYTRENKEGEVEVIFYEK